MSERPLADPTSRPEVELPPVEPFETGSDEVTISFPAKRRFWNPMTGRARESRDPWTFPNDVLG